MHFWQNAYNNYFTYCFSLIGDYVKYGTSAADLNPIGSVRASDITDLLHYFETEFGLKSFRKSVIPYFY